MENLQITLESVFKLCLFCGTLIGNYFFLKNSINILSERQKQDRKDLDELFSLARNNEKNIGDIRNYLTRLETCIEVIRDELLRKKK